VIGLGGGQKKGWLKRERDPYVNNQGTVGEMSTKTKRKQSGKGLEKKAQEKEINKKTRKL